MHKLTEKESALLDTLYFDVSFLTYGETKEALTELCEKAGWGLVEELGSVFNAFLIELIGFIPSSSPRKAKPKNFGYGSPSVYSKVMSKELRRLKYINTKVQSGAWELTEEVQSEVEALNKILAEARVQFNVNPNPKSIYVENHIEQIKKNDYSFLVGAKCFLGFLILLGIFIALSAF